MSNHMPVKQITKISRQIFRKVQLSTIKPGRNRNYEQANHKQWNKNCKKKISPYSKSSRADGFTGEPYQTFSELLMPILCKLFQKIEEKWILPKFTSKATIIVILKPDKYITHTKENYRPITPMNIDAKISKNYSKQNPKTH